MESIAGRVDSVGRERIWKVRGGFRFGGRGFAVGEGGTWQEEGPEGEGVEAGEGIGEGFERGESGGRSEVLERGEAPARPNHVKGNPGGILATGVSCFYRD